MRESFLLRISTDVPARVWSGLGDLFVPADDVETDDAIYSGAGEMLNAPDFQQLINGVAERLDIQVSGVTADTMALALEEASQIPNARVDFGRVSFDDEWQTASVTWISTWRADTLSLDRTATSLAISLSVGTEDTNRSRAPIAYFTDSDQRRRSPTDQIFDHVAGISGGTTRRFGPT